MTLKLILLICLSLVLATQAQPVKPKRIGHAHTHGEAKVDVAVEGDHANLGFDIDTNSLMGFEHPARDAKERAAVKSVYDTFRSKLNKIFIFDPALACRFSEKKLRIGADLDHPGEGEHQSLTGDIDVKCGRALIPGRFKVDLRSFYPSIQKVKIQLVTPGAAVPIDLPGAGEISLE